MCQPVSIVLVAQIGTHFIQSGGGYSIWGEYMKILEIIGSLDTFNEDHTIYVVEPWEINSEALVGEEPVEGGLPKEANDMRMKYFLEVFLAKDFLAGLQSNTLLPLSIEDKCNRLVAYAINDA